MECMGGMKAADDREEGRRQAQRRAIHASACVIDALASKVYSLAHGGQMKTLPVAPRSGEA
jgi:hypothetical protein